MAEPKKTRKPRDPNAPKQERPLFVVYSLDRAEGLSDKEAVRLHVATRNAAEAMDALEGFPGASYKKVVVQSGRGKPAA
jgi:hypothetical protein